MSLPSFSASLPSYNRNESSRALLHKRGSENSHFGSRCIQIDDGSVYLSSLAVITLVSTTIATIGILLFSLVITLPVMLGSCQGQPSALKAISPLKNFGSCDSFILNAEVNNLQGWILSKDCVARVEYFMTRGEYSVNFAGAIRAAAEYLKSLPLKGDGLDVVVMDIDETVLSNLPYYVKHNYGAQNFNEDTWNEWVDKAAATPLNASLSFYNELKALNIGVFLLTGRPENQRNVTIVNLIAAGYEGWIELLLRSPAESGLKAVQYKSDRRLQLEQEGYRILASLGDQWSDLLGPASGNRTFKLPNPMYYIL